MNSGTAMHIGICNRKAIPSYLFCQLVVKNVTEAGVHLDSCFMA